MEVFIVKKESQWLMWNFFIDILKCGILSLTFSNVGGRQINYQRIFTIFNGVVYLLEVLDFLSDF